MSRNDNLHHVAILIRHASREVHWHKPESEHHIANRKGWYPKGESGFEKGYPRTHALAGRLCDELENEGISIAIVRHSRHEVARETAEIYGRVCKERGKFAGEIEPCGDLTPRTPSSNDIAMEQVNNSTTEITNFPLNQENAGRVRYAYVVIGHQPQLTQIARTLLKKPLLPGDYLPGDSLPVGNSEVACIGLKDQQRLLWLLTEKPEPLLAELKDKVKSKYDVAKFFLGAFVVNTGLILNAGIWGDPQKWADAPIAKLFTYMAVIVALISLIFTAATLFSYDSLMMPASLWSEPSNESRWSKLLRKLRRRYRNPPKWSVSRPPSQAHVVLFYEMMHIWKVFFIPAIVSAFIAIGCLVFAMMCRDEDCLYSVSAPSIPWWVFVVLAMAIVLVLLVFYWRKKPRLGTED